MNAVFVRSKSKTCGRSAGESHIRAATSASIWMMTLSTRSDHARVGSTRGEIISSAGEVLQAVIACILEDQSSWEAMARFCDLVMASRDAEEREREWDPSSAPQRRRRDGRRGREAPAQPP